MRVGILTFHHVTNYGAVLQAYALAKVIKEEGYDVEFIDYRPYKAIKFYLNQLYPIRFKEFNLYLNRHFLGNTIKSFKIRKFMLSRMELSQRKYYTKAKLKKFCCDYDAVICGSDEVWNIESFRGFDTSYFLDICDESTLKISYAASFGSTKTLGNDKEEACNLINRFNNISVRDSNSLQIISRECGRQATKVLDPTLLISYDDILLIPKIEEEYILIYDNTTWTVEEENFVSSLAKAKNLIIVSIGSYQKIAHKNLLGVGPGEWLGYFAKASYVVTSTFHGTIFSIIFKKQFTAFSIEIKANKINDLLSNIGLESRIFSKGKGLDFVLSQSSVIDYDSVDNILEEDILNSKTYLLEALNGKR